MRTYGLDIETHDPCLKDHGKEKARGASWVFGLGEVLVTGLYNHKSGAKKALPGNGGETIRMILTDPNAEVVGARIVYDLGWLCSTLGIDAHDVKCQLVDVALVESVIDEYQPFALDDLAWKYLHERKGSEKLVGIAAKHNLRGDFRGHLKVLWYGDKEKGIPSYRDEIKEYVLSDADQPVRIWQEQKKILSELDLWEPANRKNKLIPVTLAMKQRGVRIDTKKKLENFKIADAAREKLATAFREKYGEVNLNSTKQVAALLDREKVPYRHKLTIKGPIGGRPYVGPEVWQARKQLKLVIPGVRVKKGKVVVYVAKQYAGRTAADLEDMGYAVTNNPNIDKYAIESLRGKYPVVAEMAELKLVNSIITKFLGPEFDRFIAPDGRIHADFNISGARQTGRFSSSAPNLQQVPSKIILFRKTDHEVPLAKMCREIIVPDEGMMLGKMDYSGQENVLMAHFAVGRGAEEVRRQYRENAEFDFHAYMGELTGLYVKYGPEVGRKYAKNCSFGLGYGMQIATMMEQFGWDQETAQMIMDSYNDAAPFVKDTMDMASQLIVERGYIRTLGKKKLHLQKYNGKPDVRSAYKGFNKLIQGSGVDLMEEALVTIYYSGLDLIFPLQLTVHDEVIFGVPLKASALKLIPDMQKAMEQGILEPDGSRRLSVPIHADPELGRDWGHMQDFKKIAPKLKRRAA